MHDNTKFSTACEIATQPQQGSCTVYVVFYILFQSHLYLITTRTKIYICSQYLYFPFGSPGNFSHRVGLKLPWQAGFISTSSLKPFQLENQLYCQWFQEASFYLYYVTNSQRTQNQNKQENTNRLGENPNRSAFKDLVFVIPKIEVYLVPSTSERQFSFLNTKYTSQVHKASSTLLYQEGNKAQSRISPTVMVIAKCDSFSNIDSQK